MTMDELCKAEAVCVSELASYLVASVKFLSFKCKVRLSQGLSLYGSFSFVGVQKF